MKKKLTRERVCKYLRDMGVSQKKQGFELLVEAILLAARNGGRVRSNEIFSTLARARSMSVQGVERNVANALQCVCDYYTPKSVIVAALRDLKA